jgi:hypothetical protein
MRKVRHVATAMIACVQTRLQGRVRSPRPVPLPSPGRLGYSFVTAKLMRPPSWDCCKSRFAAQLSACRLPAQAVDFADHQLERPKCFAQARRNAASRVAPKMSRRGRASTVRTTPEGSLGWMLTRNRSAIVLTSLRSSQGPIVGRERTRGASSATTSFRLLPCVWHRKGRALPRFGCMLGSRSRDRSRQRPARSFTSPSAVSLC